MFAPNQATHQLADRIHEERQAHASLIAKVKADRADPDPVGRDVHRGITRRRLTAGLLGTLVSAFGR